jgi:hypothetical protein
MVVSRRFPRQSVCTREDFLDEVVYYESIKREIETRPIYECRWDERLKTKVEESIILLLLGIYTSHRHWVARGTRRVSILVLGSNLKKWNKNWNKFELWPKFSGINIRNWNCLRICPNLNVPKFGIKIPWWEVRSTVAWNLRCHVTTVYFLVEIDRESVLSPIFRGLCDVWLKSAAFVMDECNVSSLGSPEL